MIHRFLPVLIAGLLVLAGCNDIEATDDRQGGASSTAAPAPTPALYKIENNAGMVEGWLFGTMHALPDKAKWKTQALSDTIDAADSVVVEVAGLENEAGIAQYFAQLAQNPHCPPLNTRVASDKRDSLRRLIARSDATEKQLACMDSWAAALVLARTTSSNDSANGVDKAILRAFPADKVIELEGAEQQLQIFDTLPEKEQRDLLASIIAQSEQAAQQEEALTHAWLSGDLDAIEAAGENSFLSDPELRAALLTARNKAWAGRIEQVTQKNPPILIAVGAAHLPGKDGLVALLEQRGFSVARIQ